jgi:hypothetical protein
MFLRPKLSQQFPTPIENKYLPHFMLRPTLPLFSRFNFPPLKTQTIILYTSTQLLLILLYFHPVILKEPIHIPQAPFSQVSSPSIIDFLKPFLITPKLTARSTMVVARGGGAGGATVGGPGGGENNQVLPPRIFAKVAARYSPLVLPVPC